MHTIEHSDFLTCGHRAGDLVVVVGLLRSVLVQPVGLFKEQHNVGGLREVRLHPGRLELGQVLHPLVPHPLLVVDFLLLLDDASDVCLDRLLGYL